MELWSFLCKCQMCCNLVMVLVKELEGFLSWIIGICEIMLSFTFEEKLVVIIVRNDIQSSPCYEHSFDNGIYLSWTVMVTWLDHVWHRLTLRKVLLNLVIIFRLCSMLNRKVITVCFSLSNCDERFCLQISRLSCFDISPWSWHQRSSVYMLEGGNPLSKS